MYFVTTLCLMYGVKPRALYKGSYNYSMDGDQISGLVFDELSYIHIHMHKKNVL